MAFEISISGYDYQWIRQNILYADKRTTKYDFDGNDLKSNVFS
jgi:hypothetical protein